MMSFEKEIQQKVEELSRDLSGDLELQLDVQFELENHLWESYDANLARGLTEEESREQAFKDFGALNEVKERLLAANLKRLNQRAQLKALLWYAFVPFAIVMALFLGGREYYEISRSLPQSAIDPQITQMRQLESDFNDELYEKMRQLSPNNAYLDSLWLGAHLEDSVDIEKNELISEPEFAKLVAKMHEMVNKSDFKAWREEEMAVRRSFGQESLIKTLKNTGHAAGFILPDLGSLRSFAKVTIKRGEVDEIHLLEKVCKQRLQNSYTLIEVLVIGAIGNVYMKNKSLLENEDLASANQFFANVAKVITDWKAKKKIPNQESEKLLNERGSVLASMVLPAIGMTEEMRDTQFYKANREMEYNFFEKYYFSVLNALAFIIMCLFLIFLIWQKFFKKESQAIELYSMKEWGRHYFSFMILPLLIYQLYKLLPFASINWSIKQTIWLYVSELLILTLLLFCISSWLLFRKYRQKLILFDLADKKTLSNSKTLFYVGCLSISVLTMLRLFMALITKGNESLEVLQLMGFVGRVSFDFSYGVLISLVLPLVLIICLLKYSKVSAVALRSIVRGQLINLAFLSLSLSIYSFIYLSHLERQNVLGDRLLNNDVGFTTIEVQVTEQLKQDMLRK